MKDGGGHRVVAWRDDGLEQKGGWGVGLGGRSITTGLGMKPVRGCDSAQMQRPAIRSTAHSPMFLCAYGTWGCLLSRMSAILLVVVVFEFEFKYFLGSIYHLWLN